MPSLMDSRQLIHETAPVAVILLFWGILSAFPGDVIATGVRNAGVVMALLYVTVRGVQLAGTVGSTSHPDDLAGLLRENVQVALLAGAWFLAAFLASAARPIGAALSEFSTPYPGVTLGSIFNGVLEPLAFVFTWTGVATVILYAIAVGLPRTRSRISEAGNSEGGDTQAGD